MAHNGNSLDKRACGAQRYSCSYPSARLRTAMEEKDLIHRMPHLVLCSKAQVCLHATPLAGPSLLGHANHSLLEHDSNREYEDHVEISGRQLCLDSRTRVDLRKCPYLLLRIIANEPMMDGCDGCDWVTLYKTTTQEPKHPGITSALVARRLLICSRFSARSMLHGLLEMVRDPRESLNSMRRELSGWSIPSASRLDLL